MNRDHVTCIADHVERAREEELALDRKLDSGRFGAVASSDPWPRHDAALCESYQRAATRSWFFAVRNLLDLTRSDA